MTKEDPKRPEARKVGQPQVGAHDVRALPELPSHPETFLKPRKAPAPPKKTVPVSPKDAFLHPRAAPPPPPENDSHWSDDERPNDRKPTSSSGNNPAGRALRAMTGWIRRDGSSDSPTQPATLPEPKRVKHGNAR